jgi:OOP family OmpA-OmpF porin
MKHPGRALRPFFGLSLLLLTVCPAVPAMALDLAWPAEAEQVTREDGPTAGYRIATGPYDGTGVPAREVEGALSEEVWRIPGDIGAPAAMLEFLRGQLTAQGYEIAFACADRACGGFDFRFALPIAEGPAMHVDLGAFHYLSATRTTDRGPDHVVLTISRGGERGYVHLAHLAPPGPAPEPPTSPTPPSEARADAGLIAQLAATGAAVLSDVTFETGASSLSGDRFDSLGVLAAYLAGDPARRVILVGHTDIEGSLEANIAVSRARAAAVRSYLIEALGADPIQIEAEGIGYLAPRASNGDPDGREANRRVEVVLIAD